jgi:hypothetical protein
LQSAYRYITTEAKRIQVHHNRGKPHTGPTEANRIQEKSQKWLNAYRSQLRQTAYRYGHNRGKLQTGTVTKVAIRIQYRSQQRQPVYRHGHKSGYPYTGHNRGKPHTGKVTKVAIRI